MNQLITLTASKIPAFVVAVSERAQTRYWEFFVSNIRNPNTRRSYAGTEGRSALLPVSAAKLGEAG